MSDRLAAAVTELVDALREEMAQISRPVDAGPIELMSPATFSRRAGLGRSTVYLGIADQTIRSVRVRNRRLIPSSELARLAAAASPPRETPPGRKGPGRSTRITRPGRRTEGSTSARRTTTEA